MQNVKNFLCELLDPKCHSAKGLIQNVAMRDVGCEVSRCEMSMRIVVVRNVLAYEPIIY